jgi:hypothetical protein
MNSYFSQIRTGNKIHAEITAVLWDAGFRLHPDDAQRAWRADGLIARLTPKGVELCALREFVGFADGAKRRFSNPSKLASALRCRF